jgi:hypothetical protein
MSNPAMNIAMSTTGSISQRRGCAPASVAAGRLESRYDRAVLNCKPLGP